MVTRARAVLGLLMLVALWPLVPLTLSVVAGADPGKLMSFGMYATPIRRLSDVELEVLVQRGEGGQPETPFELVPLAQLEPLATGYRTDRLILGSLASERALVERVRALTGARRVRLEVTTLRLDRRSGLAVEELVSLER